MTNLPPVLPIQPFTRPARSEVTLPGSKSISNRVLLLAALCQGTTTLHDLLDSDDTRVMLDALRHMGCALDVQGSTVRSKHVGKDILAGLKNIVGGELTSYTELLQEARDEATQRMVEQAKSIGANAVIGKSVRIGGGCAIGPNCSILHAMIGDRVIVHPGCRIGQDGFGYVSNAKGHMKVPQVGIVVIHDDVEIGANTCIDRGGIRNTVIGEGSKIDNLVQIGHNVQIGKRCILVAMCGISGSVTIEDHAVLAGAVGIAPHAVIGKGAAQSWQLDNRGKTMCEGKFDFGFAVDWMRKDLSICIAEARRNGAHLPVTALVDQFYSEIQKMGGGRWDTSSLLARLER